HGLHRLGVPVDLDVELDVDVGPDVVGTDQARGPPAADDLHGLDRDVHDLGAVDDREHDHAGEGHDDVVPLGDDEGLPLRHLAEQPADHQAEQQQDDDGDRDDDDDDGGG